MCIDALANFIALGLEEALVGKMGEKESFIKNFGLDEISEDQKAKTIGDLVSMSQLGYITGSLI